MVITFLKMEIQIRFFYFSKEVAGVMVKILKKHSKIVMEEVKL